MLIEWLTEITEKLSKILWGTPLLLLILGTGLNFTLKTHCFQLLKPGCWLGRSLGSIFNNRDVTRHTGEKEKSISPFQAMATALAASLGTGNIAGVATAVATGGPGAVFWMWISALFGMMTSFAENALGIYFRRKNSKGEWCGGAMYILREGLSGRKRIGNLLAWLFAWFCVLASFGVGNLTQVNTIAVTMRDTFQLSPMLTGITVTFFAGLILLGGIKRIGAATESIVPIMAVLYTLGALIVICMNINQLLPTLSSIIKGAFGFRAVAGGMSGALIRKAVSVGVKRGVFSNEAGMGSSVLVHCASNITEPAEQGFWGMFEVFFDTIVMCTLTALVILMPNTKGAQGATLVAKAFAENGFGNYGSAFIAISILFFAFSTCLGWSYYGASCAEYLFGTKAAGPYRFIFLLFMLLGAVADVKLVWDIADNFNALMAIPNLIGVLAQSGLVLRIYKNYMERKVWKTAPNAPPLLSYKQRK